MNESLKSPETLAASVEKATLVLKSGGVIAYPTETVYGIGANIYNRAAVNRVFALKRRNINHPLAVMIGSIDDVFDLCEGYESYQIFLMKRFWPGPLTLVMRAGQNVPPEIRSNENKVGLRIPDHPVTRLLMKSHPQPITTTSANRSGQKPAIDARSVETTIGAELDHIIDGGTCIAQIPSTVLDVCSPEPKLIREGAITFTRIKEALEERDGAK